MRRWMVICLLMWLPLQWAGAATWAYGGLGARLAHQHVLAAHAPGSADEASPADLAAAFDHAALAADSDDADASTGEPDDGCPLCQDTDWQATAGSALPVLGGAAVAPQVEHALAIRSYVPPVPKPPARAAA